SKKESFGIEISDVHENNTIEVSDDDKNRRIRTIITAKGKFKRRLLETKISLDDRHAKDLRELPLSVEIHFDELAKYAGTKEPVGMLRFHEAINSGDGVVNEPDQLTLAMLLPDMWAHRFTERGRSVWLAIEIDGFHTIEQGYMPGTATK